MFSSHNENKEYESFREVRKNKRNCQMEVSRVASNQS